MVWIQVWNDPSEFVRSDTIGSVYYRPLRRGQSEDWIEIVARPQERVILQISVNAGNIPKIDRDIKGWQILINTRAQQVIREVIRVISEAEPSGKVIALKDLITFDFEQEPPKHLEIEVWVWDIECENCKKETPVVYPVGSFFGFMLEFNFLTNLPLLLADRYDFFKKGAAKGKEGEEYRNACVHCDHTQPDWRVMESYLELVNKPDLIREKAHITVPLTAPEQEEYRKAGISSNW